MSETISNRPPANPKPAGPAGAVTHRRQHGLLVAGIIVVLLVVLFIIWKRHGHAATQTAAGGRRGGAGLGPVMVSTTKAQQGSIGIYVNALGVVTPLNTVSVSSRVQGQITAVNFQEGQMVQAGDSLVEIDPGPNQAALTQAEGQLARDSAILENAKLDLQRYQEAYSKNAIPKQQLDTQEATVHQDEGTVKLDQGLLDNAKVQMAYNHITAPISGRVGLRLVDVGNMVQAGSTVALVVITELEPINVIFNVAEDDLPAIQEQLRAGHVLAVDAFDRAQTKKIASGTLASLDNQIDPATGTVKFKAVFSNDDESLFPNQFVNARLLVKTLTNTTLLPNTVIQRNADNAFVYLLKPDQTVAMQTVTVGTTDGNVSAVEGIDPGMEVVADNFNKLTDGAKVTVRPAGGGAGSTNNVAASGAKGGHRHKQEPAE